AQTLIERGHDVVLFEKNDKLGGRLHEISLLPFKEDLRRYLNWSINTTMNCGAKIVLNTDATPDLVRAEKPDAILIALGSEPFTPPIPGIDGENVYSVIDVDTGKAKPGKRVVICGGGLSGMECGLGLSLAGHEVSIVDMIPEEDFAKDMVVITRMMLIDSLKERGVKFLGDRMIRCITNKGVEIENKRWGYETIEADTVITAFGMKPRTANLTELKHIVPETYVIGDCGGVADIGNAVHSAFNRAVEI
ncbi:MAG: NAD(P)/FAD-dependent oxidoreductase, partial [Clostridiales Family XIII bacterium]|nr:NAD(P)/FAD-dependent oxidoreductase [Clostridiales Family XIII bacterium]